MTSPTIVLIRTSPALFMTFFVKPSIHLSIPLWTMFSFAVVNSFIVQRNHTSRTHWYIKNSRSHKDTLLVNTTLQITVGFNKDSGSSPPCCCPNLILRIISGLISPFVFIMPPRYVYSPTFLEFCLFTIILIK